MNSELCYLTAITSMMTFKRGYPKVPKELFDNNAKIVNKLIDLRNNEF